MRGRLRRMGIWGLLVRALVRRVKRGSGVLGVLVGLVRVSGGGGSLVGFVGLDCCVMVV